MTATIISADPYIQPDERDEAILADRVALLDERQGPRVGDWVVFADDVVRRISHLWVWDDFEDGKRSETWTDTVQTSDGGSWYLGDGYASFSGGLYPGIPLATLELTEEMRAGSCWFFHHDHRRAHSGVRVAVDFRVYRCSLEANR